MFDSLSTSSTQPKDPPKTSLGTQWEPLLKLHRLTERAHLHFSHRSQKQQYSKQSDPSHSKQVCEIMLGEGGSDCGAIILWRYFPPPYN